uniref:Uncharacterized protein n=1 Tax=Bionectria ochroleuca TaxID=29856 RepID=A0A0B7KE74_BIOOC
MYVTPPAHFHTLRDVVTPLSEIPIGKGLRVYMNMVRNRQKHPVALSLERKTAGFGDECACSLKF